MLHGKSERRFFEEIKQTPAGDFNPELTLQKMEAITHLN